METYTVTQRIINTLATLTVYKVQLDGFTWFEAQVTDNDGKLLGKADHSSELMAFHNCLNKETRAYFL
jgi:hypothetical protein